MLSSRKRAQIEEMYPTINKYLNNIGLENISKSREQITRRNSRNIRNNGTGVLKARNIARKGKTNRSNELRYVRNDLYYHPTTNRYYIIETVMTNS